MSTEQKTKTELKVTMVGELCDHQHVSAASKHHLIPEVVEKLMQSWSTKDCYDHISPVSIPSHKAVIDIIKQARRILFPGYFTSASLHASNLEYYIGKETTELYDKLSEQITMAIRHDCRRQERPCTNCEQRASELAYHFITTLPGIASILAHDIRATLEGDPASKSPDEVIFSYPGLLAITVYRLAHELYKLEVPIVPRIMTEWAHGETGIDINPGARIGPGEVWARCTPLSIPGCCGWCCCRRYCDYCYRRTASPGRRCEHRGALHVVSIPEMISRRM